MIAKVGKAAAVTTRTPKIRDPHKKVQTAEGWRRMMIKQQKETATSGKGKSK